MPANCPNCGEPVAETIRLLLEEQSKRENPKPNRDKG